jgi:ABC-type transport system substrate-binding protein
MMKSPNKLVWLSLLLLIGLALFTACSEKQTPTPPNKETATSSPAVLPTATAAEPPATIAPATEEPTPTTPATEAGAALSANLLLDPALAQDADSLMICQYIFSGLVQVDANGQPGPALAESWVISDDGLDYIFNLRANAAFSNGDPITADIVKANFDRWLDPNQELHGDGDFVAWKTTFLGFLGEKDADQRAKSTVDGIEKVDQLTVLLHLNRPVPELLTYLANPAFAILSPEELKAGSYQAGGSQLVSSGPYKIDSWTQDTLILVPDPVFWGTAPEGELTFSLK